MEVGEDITRRWDNATSLQQGDKGLRSVKKKSILTASRCSRLQYQLLEACRSSMPSNVAGAVGGRSCNGGYNKIKKGNYEKRMLTTTGYAG